MKTALLYTCLYLVTDENKQNTQLRSSLESYCRDVQDKNVKVQKINKSFVEEETKQREELIANLTKNVSDINEKSRNTTQVRRGAGTRK